MIGAAVFLVVTLGNAAAPPQPPIYDGAFWKQWGDGQAELDGYAMTRMRYGEKRTGTLVTIFVTEPWSLSGHVKAEKEHAAGDVVQALKLNAVEDFQTGIYDYNLMTSAWTVVTQAGAASLPLGSPPKVAFSAQEWCGTTYADLVFDGPHTSEIVRSYFDGETGMHSLDNPFQAGAAALVEDNLLVWARGLAAPLVAASAPIEVAFLPALARARLLHKPLAWTSARLSRDDAAVDVDVPAGKIRSTRAHIEVLGVEPRSIDVWIEVAAPHRVVKLNASDGMELALTGTVRTPYWQKNHEGDEAMLQALGLKPPRAR